MAAEPGSVGRGAYVGGLAAGIGLAVAGYYAVPSLRLGDSGTAIAEIAAVAVAFAVTTAIWKWSAARHRLDSPAGGQDGKRP